MHFTEKQSNVQAFVNLHIRPIILLHKQYFFQDVFARFYLLVKITAAKVSIILQVMRGFTFCFCYQTTCYSLQKKYLNGSWCIRCV